MNWRKPIIYLLLHLSGSKIPQNLKEIRKVEKLSKEQIQKYQEAKLKKLLLYAYNNVPYYHKILGEVDVVENGKVNLDNFSKIPILTKEIIRREGKNLYSKEHKKRKSYENTSGGSTGEPVRFLQDKYYDDWNNSTKIFFKEFGNQNVGDKELRLWGSERDLLEGKEKFSIRARNWLYNRKELNSFKMSEKEMNDFVKSWNEFKPQWVEAYAQSIYEFAKFIKQNNLKIYSPKGVLTSAGTLYPDMKQTIQEVFKCPVYNRYGSREVGGIALSKANKDSLDIAFWNNHVEVIPKKKTETIGKIYVTTLNNFSMPLIRYDIGDMAEKGETNLELKMVVGRETESFITKKGKIVPGEFFIHFIGVVHNKGIISKFQVIQDSYDSIIIKAVINNKKEFEKYRSQIESSIDKAMEQKTKINWKFVDDIPALKNGKYLYTERRIG